MRTIDLHVHSNASDGTCSPTRIVEYAREKGLSAIALTDHDTTAGIAEAVACAAQYGDIELIPGTELSVKDGTTEVHLVGLFIDPENSVFERQTQLMKTRREERNLEMIGRFNAAGIPMTLEELQAGREGAVITRAHFARVLVEHQVVKDGKEAFHEYLGEDSPFYVPRKYTTSKEGIEIIKEAGGIPVLAHPLHYHLEEKPLRELIGRLKEWGLLAIEVKYSNHMGQDEAFVRRLAKEFELLPSGGSDFHGSNKPAIDLGSGRGNMQIPYEYLENIRTVWKEKQSKK